ncbi:MAG TPA: sugar nucleotide-binding protein [Candidatus Latescibacteria bacterium]|nr:sugar nucleotide-binding protein [Candidatus Latescibacterota bacterium]
MTTLVVGAGGTIGGGLVSALSRGGKAVESTTRATLDLADAPESWTLPAPADTAFVCAAIGAMGRCADEPQATHRVNVEHTVQLAKRLVEAGSFVVFPSTDKVFDGSRPLRRADDPPSPHSEYGRQKAEAEARLLQLGESVAILRVTKVVPACTQLLAGWAHALRAGEPIQPFSDMVMAPVSLQLTTDVLCRIAVDRISGITQLSAARDITLEAAARHLCTRLGADPALVHPASARQAPLPEGSTPAHTSLDMSRLRSLGWTAPDPFDAIDTVLPR